ncbi:MAG: hypothetical protein K0Q73_4644 [Paenibacillus sp.]|jgi:hypothetical protein|nr:hypothetical protein [Paenibacillus sp.]
MMNKDEFDDMFDKAFEEAAKADNSTPDPEDSWNKINAKLKSQVKRRKRLKLLPAVAASFLLGAIIFSTPTATQAINPFFHKLLSFQKGVITVIFGSDEGNDPEPLTSPPVPQPAANSDGMEVEVGLTTEKLFSSWEEASQFVSFSPPEIGFVPKGFKLDNVMLYIQQASNESNVSSLFYSNSNKDHYKISIRLIEPNEQIGSSFPVTKGTLETIALTNKVAYLYSNDGKLVLEYILGNLHVEISGTIERPDIMRIGNDLKKGREK